MLITECICGNDAGEMEWLAKNDLNCKVCGGCGLTHQVVNLTVEQYYNFYSEKYHLAYQKQLGQINYTDRYDSDREVAKLRLAKYQPYLTGKRLLDIGSSNGAFVDEARAAGLDAWGVEPSKSAKIETTYIGTLIEQDFIEGEFQTITMHDVLEHVIDPVTELKEIHRVLPVDGVLILDMPNFWVDCGKHHWRAVEHLWLFKEEQLKSVVENLGFEVVGRDTPIPSKYVLYAKKV